ncbi:MAG: hypothetical protein E6K79_03300 [Candidatus Eisenbacteria bacterium]|uniref:Uncharacterized protein n=1 Tax=Eiseniibacteriota bacterium TaxID=2212470 RepID=A0A538TQM8_UNCEI|nr:MAG: hypothetical protein E6K79_03300 [Candidatus Eisenbacteria bacterium]
MRSRTVPRRRSQRRARLPPRRRRPRRLPPRSPRARLRPARWTPNPRRSSRASPTRWGDSRRGIVSPISASISWS